MEKLICIVRAVTPVVALGALVFLTGCPADHGERSQIQAQVNDCERSPACAEALRMELTRLLSVTGNPTDPPVIIKGGSMHAFAPNGHNSYDSNLKQITIKPVDKNISTIQSQGYTGFLSTTGAPTSPLTASWNMDLCSDRPVPRPGTNDYSCQLGMNLAGSAGQVTATPLDPTNDQFVNPETLNWPNWKQDHFVLVDGDDVPMHYPRFIILRQGTAITTYKCKLKGSSGEMLPPDYCYVGIGTPHS